MFLHREIEAAIEALYNWVGEQFEYAKEWSINYELPDDKPFARGSAASYFRTKAHMQTLFAGLINFEQTEEKQKNGL